MQLTSLPTSFGTITVNGAQAPIVAREGFSARVLDTTGDARLPLLQAVQHAQTLRNSGAAFDAVAIAREGAALVARPVDVRVPTAGARVEPNSVDALQLAPGVERIVTANAAGAAKYDALRPYISDAATGATTLRPMTDAELGSIGRLELELGAAADGEDDVLVGSITRDDTLPALYGTLDAATTAARGAARLNAAQAVLEVEGGFVVQPVLRSNFDGEVVEFRPVGVKHLDDIDWKSTIARVLVDPTGEITLPR